MELAADILEQLCADFGAEAVNPLAEQLAETTSIARVQRCIVFKARGHRWFFNYLCKMTKLDFRDMIVTAEYGNGDPQLRLYDFSKPIPMARIEDPFAIHDFSKSSQKPQDGLPV